MFSLIKQGSFTSPNKNHKYFKASFSPSSGKKSKSILQKPDEIVILHPEKSISAKQALDTIKNARYNLNQAKSLNSDNKPIENENFELQKQISLGMHPL